MKDSVKETLMNMHPFYHWYYLNEEVHSDKITAARAWNAAIECAIKELEDTNCDGLSLTPVIAALKI